MTGEALAAGARAADRAQPAPLRRLPGARRDRGAVPGRGGVVGVRRSSATCALRPGDTFKRGRLPGHLPQGRPRSSAATRPAPARRSRSARSSTCARKGKHFVMRPSRNYYATTDPSLGAISRFFEGEATSEVDVRWGLRRDLWMAIRPDIGSLAGPDPRGRPQVRELAHRRAGVHHRRAGRPLPARPAAGGLPRDRVAARAVDLDRRRRSWCSARSWPRGRRPRRGCAGCARSTRPGWAASSRARRRPWSTPSPCWSWCDRGRGAVAAAAPPRCRGAPRGDARGRARGRQGGEVPRDPRRRAGPPDGQALPRGLARGRPRPARRGDRDPARARPARGPHCRRAAAWTARSSEDERRSLRTASRRRSSIGSGSRSTSDPPPKRARSGADAEGTGAAPASLPECNRISTMTVTRRG